MIERILKDSIIKRMGDGKAILLIGPRQVGKTTLINSILSDEKFLLLNGDDPSTRNILNEPNLEELITIIGKSKTIFIDEAQRIPYIGITLKLIIDQIPNIQVFVSGSSAFELNNLIHEPLTGRKWEYHLYPISWSELVQHYGYLKAIQQLEVRMVFGMYPEVINWSGDEVEILQQLSTSYLFKDVLAFSGIRKPELLEQLLRALAYQVGSEVNFSEIGQLLGVDKKTIAHYIDLLCKTYVVFKLPSFSRNLRNEIKRNQKIYFYDNGVRNMIIGDLNPLSSRNDIGGLWENFLISERQKKNEYSRSLSKSYFWRTTERQEIDYLEVKGDKISAFEFKWNPNSKVKIPKTFTNTYQEEVKIISSKNFGEFI